MTLAASVTTVRVLPGVAPRPDWPGRAEAAVGLATVYRHLGIDPGHEMKDASGRPVPVLAEGRPIAELI